MNKDILTVKNLSVTFGSKKFPFKAVSNISYSLQEGTVLGVVGESGSGKSVSSLALLGLIDKPGIVEADELIINNVDVTKITKEEHRLLLGKSISMIFQDALTSLDPSYTIGYQLLETLRIHDKKSNKEQLMKRAIELLDLVGIPDPHSRMSAYPFQLSGGMNQRIMIAISIAAEPKIIIADEPTTALDVTIQAQIIQLLMDLKQRNNMSLVLITHDLALVANNADNIMVMYAGEIVEYSKSEDLFINPKHPYTEALLKSIPEFSEKRSKLYSLPGVVPGKYDRPTGCLLNPRCPYATEKCITVKPQMQFVDNHYVLCHYPLNFKQEIKV